MNLECKITDFHAHTNMSYCAMPSLTPGFYATRIAESNTVSSIVIADHGMAIYFPLEVAWTWEFICDSQIFDKFRDMGNEKLSNHIASLAKYHDKGIVPGIEVEMMDGGKLTFDESFRKDLKVVIGSVHWLPVSIKLGNSPEEVMCHWKKHTFDLINAGIHILGHPFRWLNAQIVIPDNLIYEIIDEAQKANIAIELNGHYHVATDLKMIRYAAQKGVRIAFGTDSHQPREAGDLSYHLEIVKYAGLDIQNINMMKLK